MADRSVYAVTRASRVKKRRPKVVEVPLTAPGVGLHATTIASGLRAAFPASTIDVVEYTTPHLRQRAQVVRRQSQSSMGSTSVRKRIPSFHRPHQGPGAGKGRDARAAAERGPPHRADPSGDNQLYVLAVGPDFDGVPFLSQIQMMWDAITAAFAASPRPSLVVGSRMVDKTRAPRKYSTIGAAVPLLPEHRGIPPGLVILFKAVGTSSGSTFSCSSGGSGGSGGGGAGCGTGDGGGGGTGSGLEAGGSSSGPGSPTSTQASTARTGDSLGLLPELPKSTDSCVLPPIARVSFHNGSRAGGAGAGGAGGGGTNRPCSPMTAISGLTACTSMTNSLLPPLPPAAYGVAEVDKLGVDRAKFVDLLRAQSSAVVLIQYHFRRVMSRYGARSAMKVNRSATTVTRWWRGRMGHKHARLYRIERTNLAVHIQRLCRGFMGRNAAKEYRRVATTTAIHFQRLYRGHVGRRIATIVRHHMAALIFVQRIVRGFLARRSADRLRARRFQRTVAAPAASAIQRVWRGHRHRRWARETLLKPRAAVCIQSATRRFLATCVLRRLQHEYKATNNLQRLWRGTQGRRRVARLRSEERRGQAIVTLQCFFRAALARKILRFLQRRKYVATVELPAVAVITRFMQHTRARNRLRVIVIRHVAAKRIQQWHRTVSFLQKLVRSGWKPPRTQWAEKILAAFGRRVVARRRNRFAATYKRGLRLTAVSILQRWWRGCICRFHIRPQMETWRVERVRRQLDAWRMLILSLQDNVKDVLADIKSQSKLLRRSEEALRTCRRERSDRRLRIAEIPDQLKEFNERDVFEGWADALKTEMTIKIAENEMCDEDILSRKIHNHDKQWLLADLRLELDDTYADIDEAFVEETLLLEYLHNMELRLCKERREWDLRVAASAQRKLWKVKTIKKPTSDQLFFPQVALPKPVPEVSKAMGIVADRMNLPPLQMISKMVRAPEGHTTNFL